MKKWLKIILLLLVMVLKGTTTVDAAIPVHDDEGIRSWVVEQEQRQQANFSDTSLIYHICSSRPDRLEPVLDFKKADQLNRKLFVIHHFNSVLPLRCGRYHVVITRLMAELPCDYYVFALRRLLC